MSIELNSTSLLSDANLQGYWRFSNGALTTDSGPNGYTLTNNNTVTNVAGGKFAYGADFEDSSSQSLTVSGANLRISTSQTWSAWCKLESLPSVQARICAVSDSTPTNYVALTAKNSTNKFSFQVSGLTATEIDADTAFTTGLWYHVVGRYDSSANTIAIWVNGVKKSASVTGSHTAGTGDFAIGRLGSYVATATYFDGIIDDVSIFNRALTDAEVSELYYDSPHNGNWSSPYRLQADHTKVAGSANLTDFPALISSANLSAGVYAGLQSGEINDGYLLSDANLRAYYRFNSGSLTTDSGPNGYTLTNSNTVGENSSGRFGYCSDFGTANTNKALYIANDLGIAGGIITVSCWVKLRAEIGTGIWAFAVQGDVSTFVDYHIRYEYNSGTRRLLFRRVRRGVVANDISYTITLGTSNWYHLVLTYDGTNVVAYVNGVSVGSTAASGNGSSATVDGFSIGAEYSDGILANFASAFIDDIGVFNRVLTDAEVKSIYTGGGDLRITTDEAGTTEIPFEIVSLDTGAETCEIWCKVPTLDFDDNTPVYIWHGNANALPYASNATYGSQAVWSDYKGVYHLNENSGNRFDSTYNALTLTDTNTVASATGQIGTGADFETSNSEKLVTTNDGFNSTGSQTFQAWYKPESTSTDAGIMGNWDGGLSTGRAIYVNVGTPYFNTRGGTMGTKTATHTSTVTNGTWYFITGVLDVTADTISITVNGTKTTTTGATGDPGSSTEDFTLGSAGGFNAYLDGVVDEARVRFSALSDDWITTEYNNQNDPASFWLELGSASPSLSPSLSPSASQSPSSSTSPSPSSSPSSSQSPSSSISLSPSLSPSSSQSPSSSTSLSPSRSPSSSQSPSSSISPSPSLSPSSSQSPSSSVSLSPSLSPSSSVSASPSEVSSESRSPSVSVSLSPSLSISLSPSSSISLSPSASQSPSASPSQGYTDYSRGNYVALPTDDADLETLYTAQEVIDVSTDDGVRVDQDGVTEFMVHQFRNFIADQSTCQVHWNGQTTLGANVSTVYLQVFNTNTSSWETKDSDNISSSGVDFDLVADILDTTNYVDTSNVITCRIYQEAM